jgi:UDP-galactopyranose mutase
MKYSVKNYDIKKYQYVVVGSGFWGATIAERLASGLEQPVVVVDKRAHFGGNSFSSADPQTKIDVHHYGSHIFHTSDRQVWEYLGRFTRFNQYRHKVLTHYQGRLYPIPINLNTINAFFQDTFTPSSAEALLQAEAAQAGISCPDNLEEKIVSQIGWRLYEAFIRGYTLKQWETDPKDLPASIIDRLPVRMTADNQYFDDPYQGIPTEGYGALFEKMLGHPKIQVRLNTDFADIRSALHPEATIFYSGPIDQFFDYRCGLLGWRTCDFEEERHAVADWQKTAVVNYAQQDVPHIRMHEFKHYRPEHASFYLPQTVIYKEYSRFAEPHEVPYYPINTRADQARYQEYLELASRTPRVIFGGRLGQYQYLNMDQVIQKALKTYEQFIHNQIEGKICLISSL